MFLYPLGEDDSAYSTGTYSPDYSPQPSTVHPNDSRFFPETNYFPPPPTVPVDHNPNAPYPPYNPADYRPGQQSHYAPPPSNYVHAPHEDLNPGNPYAHQHQQHDPYYSQQRRPDDNVSAPVPANSGNEHFTSNSARGGSRPLPAHVDEHRTNTFTDRVNEPEGPSPVQSRDKTVQFDLNPQEEPSREASPESQHRNGDERGDQRHRRRKDDERSDSTRESGRHRKRHHRDESPGSDSDATIDLPPRFDEQGRRRDDDPLADKLESVLQSLFR